MSRYHTSVLLQEAIHALQIQKGEKYIDATLGAGGHTLAMLEKGGIVLGIDQDDEALAYVKENFKEYIAHSELVVAQGNFANIADIAAKNGFKNVSGILFDIGVSSHQLDTNARGFSFLSSGPLDMRMSTTAMVTAADLVNGLHKGEMIDLFTKYGEEPFARKIAEAIIIKRMEKQFETTQELADVIAKNVPKIGKSHPATRVFQALRIAVNDELHSLESGLTQAVGLLEKGGRLVVISFHSLEDRIVKNMFQSFAENHMGIVITKKPMLPTDEEILINKRSRSAKMRIFERV